MINSLIKTITVDGFFTPEQAMHLCSVAKNLKYQEFEFGYQVDQFNMVPDNADQLFSEVLGSSVVVDHDQSGVFRVPKHFIHFEGFDDPREWIFVCALELSFVTIYHHLESGAQSALEQHQLDYRNMLSWDYQSQHQLIPGQGLFLRPWLFHSMDSGLVQIFRMREVA